MESLTLHRASTGHQQHLLQVNIMCQENVLKISSKCSENHTPNNK